MNTFNIEKQADGSTLTLDLKGRLNTNTAPVLDTFFKESLGDVTDLILDLKDLAYISSAGLRVFLSAHKQMLKKGTMTIKNVNDTIMEIFDITGFADILTIE